MPVVGGGTKGSGRRRRGAACALAAALALVAVSPGALASPGQADRSFGENGIARPDLGPSFGSIQFSAVAAQPDGAVLATRSSSAYPPEPQLRRYQANGQLDPAAPPRPASPGLEVTLADGDTLVVTEQCCPGGVRLQRRNPDGSLDPGFAEAGERTIPISMSPRKIVVLANGKILLAGVGIYLSSQSAADQPGRGRAPQRRRLP